MQSTCASNEDLSDFISQIKQEYKKTNIKQVNLNEIMPLDISKKIGWILQNSENESNKEYKINFDPLETKFMNKLVTEDLLKQRLVITKDEFFKGILFVDYLTTVLVREYTICKKVEEFEQILEQKNPYLDPDLQLIVRYSSLYYAMKTGEDELRTGRSQVQYSKRIYDNRNRQPRGVFTRLSYVNPLYQELGTKVFNLIENNNLKEQMPEVSSTYEIKAMVFIDSIMKYLTDEEKDGVMQQLKSRNYLDASVKAIESLGHKTTHRDVNNYIRSLETNYPGRGNPNADE